MKARRFVVILTLVVVIVLVASIAAISIFLMKPPVEIRRYDAVITIDASGDMHIVETWEMTYNDPHRVKFRDIDYKKYGDDYDLPMSELNIARFDQNAVVVTVFKGDEDVTEQVTIGYSFNNDLDEFGDLIRCEPARPRCEALFVDTEAVGGLIGDFTFKYEYTIAGAVTEYSDISELNWLVFEYIAGTIEAGTLAIVLPENDHSEDDLYIWGHGIAEGDIQIVSNQTIAFSFQNVKQGEFLEFRLLAPRDMFPDIHPDNVFVHHDMNKQIIIDYQAEQIRWGNIQYLIIRVVLGISIAAAFATVLAGYYVYKRYFKPPSPRFDGDYMRELPSAHSPAEMSYMYHHKKTNNEDVTATLLDLIRRKHMHIEFDGSELTSHDADFVLTRAETVSKDALLPHENHVMKWFFDVIGDGRKVTTKAVENFSGASLANAETFQREAKRFINLVQTYIDEGASSKQKTVATPLLKTHYDFFDEQLPRKKSKALAFAAIPALALTIGLLSGFFLNIDNLYALIISGVSLALYVAFVVSRKRRSEAGVELFKQWEAFKRFLLDFGEFKDYPIPGVTVWEHYLVYATSLKVADQVMKQLEVKLPMNDDIASQSTYLGVGYRQRGFVYGYGFTRFNRSMNTARRNAAKKISAAKASSTGRGGGFGGGSSRGGGGGGIRTR